MRLERSEAGSSAKAEGGRGSFRGRRLRRRRGERDSDEDATGRGVAAGRCKPRVALIPGVSITRTVRIAAEDEHTDLERFVSRETTSAGERSS